MISLKTKQQITAMRDAGRIVAEVLALMEEMIKPGISTYELDTAAEKHIRKCHADPTFKGYQGFPASICASINEEIVHGIPKKNRVLMEGDIVSIDTGATFHDYVGDAARTFAVGKISDEKARLVRVTEESFFEGIKQAVAKNRLGDLGHAIQVHAEKHGYAIIRDLVGHGVGRNMHEDPSVPNYGMRGRGLRLEPGLTIAVEPMVAMGHYAIRVLKDGWTCVTKDGLPASHYENTIAIKADGEPEILTRL